MLKIGDKVPKFKLKNQRGEEITSDDIKGGWTVLYFYPKDNTPGCTTEAKDFTKNIKKFNEMNVEVIGVSPDSEKSHSNFCEKHGLEITLLSDPDHKFIEKFGAWALKKFMGREYMGVVRSTFVIDPENRVAHAWKSVKVKDHVKDVLDKLKELM